MPLNLTQEQWINLGISLAVVLLVAAIARRALNALLDRVVSRLTAKTATTLDDRIIDAVRGPLYWLVIVFTAQAMQARLDFVPTEWDSTVADLFFVAYFLAVFVMVWRLVSSLIDWYATEMISRSDDPKLTKGIVQFFDNMTALLLIAIGLIVLLSHFGADISGIVTTLGVGSLAVALAAQAAFEDTISGFIIMIDQPFRVGDRIEILDIETWGDVVEIGLRSSRIRTEDNRMVIVPNSVLGNSLVVNHSYPDNLYREDIPVGVAYGSDIDFARHVIIDAVKTVDGVLDSHPVEALFLTFGSSSLDFSVRFWINTYTEKWEILDRVNTSIYKALNEAGIEIPFPQRDVWHKLDESNMVRIKEVLSNGKQ